MSSVPTGGAVMGDLVVSGDQVGTTTRPIRLALASSNPPFIKLLAALSLAAALLLVGARAFVLQRKDATRFGLDTRLGPAGWKFSESWASNLTAGGALLGTLVAGSVLPDHPQFLTKAQYGGLNLFFGLLVAVAAYLYNAVVAKKDIPDDSTTNPPTPRSYQPEGFVWMYLVASMLTLWAVWGEIGTLYVMLADIIGHAKFTSLPSGLLLAGTLIVAGAGALYAWLTIGWNVEYNKEKPSGTPQTGKQMLQQLRNERAGRNVALPRFSLL